MNDEEALVLGARRYRALMLEVGPMPADLDGVVAHAMECVVLPYRKKRWWRRVFNPVDRVLGALGLISPTLGAELFLEAIGKDPNFEEKFRAARGMEEES